MSNIPRIIHYCWFGKNQKSQLIEKCIKSWSENTNYKIQEWNEDNFDVNKHNFTRAAYSLKKWAFVSDYARLEVLYQYGGIYLDTDMELFKSLDCFLDNKMFLGFMYDCNLSCGIIGVEPKNRVIKELLEIYDKLNVTNSPNNDLFTKYFLDKGLKLNNRYQRIDEIVFYPKEYFNYKGFNKKYNYAIHHFEDSWKEHNIQRDRLKKVLKVCIGEVLYGKLSNYHAVKKSPFYSIYRNHKKESN